MPRRNTEEHTAHSTAGSQQREGQRRRRTAAGQCSPPSGRGRSIRTTSPAGCTSAPSAATSCSPGAGQRGNCDSSEVSPCSAAKYAHQSPWPAFSDTFQPDSVSKVEEKKENVNEQSCSPSPNVTNSSDEKAIKKFMEDLILDSFTTYYFK